MDFVYADYQGAIPPGMHQSATSSTFSEAPVYDFSYEEDFLADFDFSSWASNNNLNVPTWSTPLHSDPALSWPVYLGESNMTAEEPVAAAVAAEVPITTAVVNPAEVPDPTGKGFFGLHPEIRLEVYRKLVESKVIVIRGFNGRMQGRRRTAKWVEHFPRDKEMGLNIMFASKAFLAEARPALLSRATFDLRLSAILCRTKANYIKKQQHFGRPELTMLRSIEVEGAFEALEGLKTQLSAMPFLHSVVLNHEPRTKRQQLKYSVQLEEVKKTATAWNNFVTELISPRLAVPINWPGHKTMLAHVRDSGKRASRPAMYLLKMPAQLGVQPLQPWALTPVFIYFNYCNRTVQIVEAANEDNVLVAPRREPRLFSGLL